MADFLYNLGRQGFADGSINWASGDIRLTMTTSSYAPTSSSTNEFLSDITNEGTGTRSASFGTKTETNGVCNAANLTLSAVPSQTALNAIVIYQWTGSAATSRLIAYITSYTGLPITPNGADININFPTDANKIFKL